MKHRLFPCLLAGLVLLSCVGVAGAAGRDGDRDDRDHDRREHRHRHDQPLTSEQIDQSLELLRRIDAEAADRVARLRQEDPERVEAELRRQIPRLEGFLALRRYDPQMYELRVEDYRLARESRDVAKRLMQARREDDRNERELERKLEDLVEAHFEIRQQIRERELAWLQRRIERLREQLDERADERKSLIEQRIAELTESGEAAQW